MKYSFLFGALFVSSLQVLNLSSVHGAEIYPPQLPPRPTPNPLLQPAPAPLPTRDPNQPIYEKPLGNGKAIELNPSSLDYKVNTENGTHRIGVEGQSNPPGAGIRYEYQPK